jgi:hypothetical protein
VYRLMWAMRQKSWAIRDGLFLLTLQRHWPMQLLMRLPNDPTLSGRQGGKRLVTVSSTTFQLKKW